MNIETKQNNRILPQLNMPFGRELVVLQTKPSLFGKFGYWRYYGGLDEEHSILRVETRIGMPRGAKMKLDLNQLK